MDQDFKTIIEGWCVKNLGDDKSEVVAISRAELDRLNWTATMATDILGKLVSRYDEFVKKTIVTFNNGSIVDAAITFRKEDIDSLNKMMVAAESFLEQLDS